MRRYSDHARRGGADHLAKVFGTEEDKVNCSFYFKIGACRHGERCSRLHIKPLFSQTILVPNMYHALPENADPQEQIDHYDDFFEEVFAELSKFGKIEHMMTCLNSGDHLLGNLYVMFSDEDASDKAVASLSERYYGGLPLRCELCPVTDFNDAGCRQFVEGTCNRGNFCNFLHIRPISRDLEDFLYDKYGYKPPNVRGRGRFPGRGRGGGGGGGGYRGSSGGGGGGGYGGGRSSRDRGYSGGGGSSGGASTSLAPSSSYAAPSIAPPPAAAAAAAPPPTDDYRGFRRPEPEVRRVERPRSPPKPNDAPAPEKAPPAATDLLMQFAGASYGMPQQPPM